MLHCSLQPVVLLLYVTLQSPVRGVTAVCYTAVPSPWCYCCMLHCSLQPVVLVLYATLQSPARGVTAVCYTAVSSPWCYCCMLHCSLHPVVLLLYATLQSPSRGVTAVYYTAVSSCDVGALLYFKVSSPWYYCHVNYVCTTVSSLLCYLMCAGRRCSLHYISMTLLHQTPFSLHRGDSSAFVPLKIGNIDQAFIEKYVIPKLC